MLDPRRAPTTVDGVVRVGGKTHGDQPAVSLAGGRTLSFAALDAAVDRACSAFTRMLSGTCGRAVVGLVSQLDPEFAVAYHAVMRSGHIVLVLNPYMHGSALRKVLARTGTSLVITDAGEATQLGTDPMPGLRVLVWSSASADAAVESLQDEMDRNSTEPAVERSNLGGQHLACLQLTSGTTGQPKIVKLLHRNLVANAEQIAGAHQLTSDSAVLNHLPTYHPMHLNSALSAGTHQVLCPEPDPVAALEIADASRATHFYGLPVRLARLADDSRLLACTRPRNLRAVLSGGSALAPEYADTLASALAIPVVQGYGLAETSPLITSSPFEGHRHGSVGTAVSGTECRIMDLEDGRELNTGELGEIEVRGPQVMAGYLGHGPGDSGIDAEGWLRTGDVGQLDKDGNLFIVDRIKDVFKCDNWLVAPTAIEHHLRAHPAVRDCVVFDHPHPYRGAVAHALVIRAGAECRPETIAGETNEQLPEHEQLHYLDIVEEIPRAGSGKIRRRELRDETLAGHANSPEEASWSLSSTA